MAASDSVASLAVSMAWGRTAADVVTALIVVTAIRSVFAGLLGGSRVPFNAARARVFFGIFGRMHPRYDFPHIALLVMGVLTAAGSLLDLTTVINMLTTVAVLVQAIAQIVALTVLRRRRPELRQPYRQWLYPVPSILALAGWAYVYESADARSIWLSLVWIAVGSSHSLSGRGSTGPGRSPRCGSASPTSTSSARRRTPDAATHKPCRAECGHRPSACHDKSMDSAAR